MTQYDTKYDTKCNTKMKKAQPDGWAKVLILLFSILNFRIDRFYKKFISACS